MSKPSAGFKKGRWDVWGFGNGVSLLPQADGTVLTAFEIEMESSKYTDSNVHRYLVANNLTQWIRAEEGSLRNDGFEIVFREPLPFEQAITALRGVMPLFAESKRTFRAAVHGHFNIQHLSREDYVRAVLAYFLLEHEFYAYVGEGRDESVFCVPWYKAIAHVKELIAAYQTGDAYAWTSAIRQSPKYAGVNLRASYVYGSLEFRHLQTPTGDPEACVVAIESYMRKCLEIITLATSDLGRGSLMEFMDEVAFNRGVVIDPAHLCTVYSVLAMNIEVDTMKLGLSFKSIKELLGKLYVTPSWRRRAAVVQQGSETNYFIGDI